MKMNELKMRFKKLKIQTKGTMRNELLNSATWIITLKMEIKIHPNTGTSKRIKIDHLVKSNYESVKTQDRLLEIWKEVNKKFTIIKNNFINHHSLVICLLLLETTTKSCWTLSPCISLREWPSDQLADALGIVNKMANRWESREQRAGAGKLLLSLGMWLHLE